MSALRDRVLSSSLDDLVGAAERGEIDPDQVWTEVLDSLGRSANILRQMAETQEQTNAFLKSRLPELIARQDRIDATIAEWRSLHDPPERSPAERRPERAKAFRDA